jgi:hypothetical protein
MGKSHFRKGNSPLGGDGAARIRVSTRIPEAARRAAWRCEGFASAVGPDSSPGPSGPAGPCAIVRKSVVGIRSRIPHWKFG